MSHRHERFGPPPVLVVPALSNSSVLVGQMVLCSVALMMIQPPFVMTTSPVTPELGSMLSIGKILAVAFTATAATWALHASGTSPTESFQGACELMYRASQ